MFDDAGSLASASSLGSSRRADAEIIMGLKEEQGKLSVKAREKFQLKHRFNPMAPPPYTATSCFMFRPSSKLRQKIYKMVTKRKFDYLMMLFIGFQCALMTLETPDMDTSTTLYKVR